MRLLAASRLVLPVTSNLLPVFLDLHVAELADLSETAALLPQAANDLTAHCGFTVSEGATVTLSAVGVVKEIAVISMVSHVQDGGLDSRPGCSLRGQQDSP